MVTVKRRLLGQVTVTPVQRRRRGFSLAEMLVALIIISMLAAMVIPTIFGRIRSARADTVIAEMRSLQDGIMLFERDVGRYPLRLTYLNALVSGNFDLCGVAIPDPNVARWRGPYINRAITFVPSTTKYLISGGDTVEAVLSFTAQTGNARVLQIAVHGPTAEVSNEIDLKVDGIVGATTGFVQISGNVVSWTFPIRGTAC